MLAFGIVFTTVMGFISRLLPEFVLLGGPLEGTSEVLLIGRAEAAEKNSTAASSRFLAPHGPAAHFAGHAVGPAARLFARA